MSRWSTNKFYSRMAPVASSTSVGQGQGRQGITVRGRDHVFAVKFESIYEAKTTSWSVPKSSTQTVLNPANASMFPWMSKMAKLFQTYKFLDLKFVYEPQCPSSMTGLAAMWYDPDPTNVVFDKEALDMGDLTQRGVSVHGAVWAKHMLSVPQSLCASRNEYYIRETFPPINIAANVGNGVMSAPFRFDPLEYFPGLFGIQVSDFLSDFEAKRLEAMSATPSDKAKFSYTYGRVYVEYAIAFGKAESTVESVVSAGPLALQVPVRVASSMQSASHAMFRNATGAAAIGTPCVLYGVGQVDKPSNVSLGGNVYFNQDPSTQELIAIHDCEFMCLISLAGASGAWSSPNALRLGVRPVSSNTYTETVSGVLDLPDGQKVNERYTAGFTTTIQMSAFAVKLNAGDAFKVGLANNGTITGWSTTSPGFSIRFYACAYNADAAPF